MTYHIDDHRLQDFREGLLDEEAEAEVRRHLDECPECKRQLEGLDEVLSGLKDLPLEATPSRDLWPQVAWRMEGSKARGTEPEGGADDGENPVPAATSRPWVTRTRFTVTAWQLLAASIALIVVSGGSVWAFLNARVGQDAGPAFSAPSPAHHVAWEEAYAVFDRAVADLEVILDQGSELLDPETVRVLQENLTAIDHAIQEARTALDEDPASEVLQRLLADHLRKKVDLLRQAAGAVYSST
jgi:hypothetical protein